MTARIGKCINFGWCSVANSKMLLHEQEGKSFACAECGGYLIPVTSKTTRKSIFKFIGALVGMALILSFIVAGIYWLYQYCT